MVSKILDIVEEYIRKNAGLHQQLSEFAELTLNSVFILECRFLFIESYDLLNQAFFSNHAIKSKSNYKSVLRQIRQLSDECFNHIVNTFKYNEAVAVKLIFVGNVLEGVFEHIESIKRTNT